MTDPSLEQKIEHNRKRRKDNFEASSRLDWKDVRLAAEGGNKAMERWIMKLDLNTLKILYTQIKCYEDRIWIGFLISREERKYETT